MSRRKSLALYDTVENCFVFSYLLSLPFLYRKSYQICGDDKFSCKNEYIYAINISTLTLRNHTFLQKSLRSDILVNSWTVSFAS